MQDSGNFEWYYLVDYSIAMVPVVILLLIMPLLVGWFASSNYNKSFWKWFGISILITPLIAALVLYYKEKRKAENQAA